MIRSAIVLTVVLLPGAAWSQSFQDRKDSVASPIEDRWQVTVTATAEPVIGTDRPNFGQTVRDEAEYGLAVELARNDFIFSGTTLKITPNLSHNPNLLDSEPEDPESAASLQVKYQRKNALSEALRADSRAQELQDTITPFVQYEISQGFENFLGERAALDHEVEVGAVYENIVNYLCIDNEVPGRAGAGDCTGAGGLAYELGVSALWVGSDERDNRRWGPKFLASIGWPFLAGYKVEIGGELQNDNYFDELSSDGEERVDWTLEVTASIDFSAPLRAALPTIPEELAFKIGLRHAEAWSNDDQEDQSRTFLVPSITYERTF